MSTKNQYEAVSEAEPDSAKMTNLLSDLFMENVNQMVVFLQETIQLCRRKFNCKWVYVIALYFSYLVSVIIVP